MSENGCLNDIHHKNIQCERLLVKKDNNSILSTDSDNQIVLGGPNNNVVFNGNIIPNNDNITLGTEENPFKELYVSDETIVLVNDSSSPNMKLFTDNNELKAGLSNDISNAVSIHRTNKQVNTLNNSLGLGIYCLSNYSNSLQNGTQTEPFNNIQTAINNAISGQTIYLNGVFIITTPIVLPNDKDLDIIGSTNAEICYSTFNVNNGDIFQQLQSNCTKKYNIKNINFTKCRWGINILSADTIFFENCFFVNCGWSGSNISLTGSFISGSSALQSIYNNNTDVMADGGGICVKNTRVTNIRDCEISFSLHGICLFDCGMNNGSGYVRESQIFDNLLNGVTLSSLTNTTGCENIIVILLNIFRIGKTGVSIIRGTGNTFSICAIAGCWNSGVYLESNSNTTMTNITLFSNNICSFSAIGETSNIKDEGNLIISGDSIRTNATRIVQLASCGLSTTSPVPSLNNNSNGIFINTDVGNITTSNNIISIRSNSFRKNTNAISNLALLTNCNLFIHNNQFLDNTIDILNNSSSGVFKSSFNSSSNDISNTINNNSTTTNNWYISYGSTANELVNNRLNNSGYLSKNPVYWGETLEPDTEFVWVHDNTITYSIGIWQGSTIDVTGATSINNSNWNARLHFGTTSTGNTGRLLINANETHRSINFTFINNQNKQVSNGNTFILRYENNKLYFYIYNTDGAYKSYEIVGNSINTYTASSLTISATSEVNVSLPAITKRNVNFENQLIASYGSNANTILQDNNVLDVDTFLTYQPYHLAENLKQDTEIVFNFQKDNSNFNAYSFGIWSGSTSTSITNAWQDQYWSHKIAIDIQTNGNGFIIKNNGTPGNDTYNTIGFDITTKYTLAANDIHTLAFSYENNKLVLYQITDNKYIKITESLSTFTSSSLKITFAGLYTNNITAKLPSITRRPNVYHFIHRYYTINDYHWNDGIKYRSVVKSNEALTVGKKFILSLPFIDSDRNFNFAFEYTGGTTLHDNPIREYFTYKFKVRDVDNELRFFDGQWSLNTSASKYDASRESYNYNTNNIPIGTIEFQYNTASLITLFSVTNNEIIATASYDGSPFHIIIGQRENTLTNIPIISKAIDIETTTTNTSITHHNTDMVIGNDNTDILVVNSNTTFQNNTTFNNDIIFNGKIKNNLGIGTDNPLELLHLYTTQGYSSAILGPNILLENGTSLARANYTQINGSGSDPTAAGYLTLTSWPDNFYPRQFIFNRRDQQTQWTNDYDLNYRSKIEYGFSNYFNRNDSDSKYYPRGSSLRFHTANYDAAPTEKVCIDSNGYVGIGITNPTTMLDVNGTITCTGFNNTSDYKIKFNQNNINTFNALNIINKLEPKIYEKINVINNTIPSQHNWNILKNNYHWNVECGLIAQDINKINELKIFVKNNNNNLLSIDYNSIFNYHIAATNELTKQLNIEKNKNKLLENRLTNLENRLDILESKL